LQKLTKIFIIKNLNSNRFHWNINLECILTMNSSLKLRKKRLVFKTALESLGQILYTKWYFHHFWRLGIYAMMNA
jgi:hypothetical protein